MTKLSDTQMIILSNAAQRDDRIALPLPPKLKGGAAAKVVATMIAKGLIQEVPARRNGLQDGDPVWRESDNGRATTLAITLAGLAAIGVDPEDEGFNEAAGMGATIDANNTGVAEQRESPQPATSADTGAPANGANHDASAGDTAPTAPTGAKVRAPREGTKQAQIIALLRQPGGATIEEIVAASGWQSHTARGFMSGALKRKLGLIVTSEKVESRGRVYKIRN